MEEDEDWPSAVCNELSPQNEDKFQLFPNFLCAAEFKETAALSLFFKGSKGKVRSLLFNNWSAVFVHPIAASLLPDWWCKRLEGTEHIRRERRREQPCLTSPGWIPNEKKNILKNIGGCFGSWTKELPPVWSVHFGVLRGFRSFLEGPAWRVKTEARMIHPHVYRDGPAFSYIYSREVNSHDECCWRTNPATLLAPHV